MFESLGGLKVMLNSYQLHNLGSIQVILRFLTFTVIAVIKLAKYLPHKMTKFLLTVKNIVLQTPIESISIVQTRSSLLNDKRDICRNIIFATILFIKEIYLIFFKSFVFANLFIQILQ